MHELVYTIRVHWSESKTRHEEALRIVNLPYNEHVINSIIVVAVLLFAYTFESQAIPSVVGILLD